MACPGLGFPTLQLGLFSALQLFRKTWWFWHCWPAQAMLGQAVSCHAMAATYTLACLQIAWQWHLSMLIASWEWGAFNRTLFQSWTEELSVGTALLQVWGEAVWLHVRLLCSCALTCLLSRSPLTHLRQAASAGSAWVAVVVLLLCGKANWQGASVT